MQFEWAPRRGTFIDIAREGASLSSAASAADVAALATFDTIYRALCASMYNYAPLSGHPGGSISSGRFAAALLFTALDYDIGDPDREDADIVSYAAGHKALGLYALWALRDEIVGAGAPELLPRDPRYRLRLVDLLGFRRNPVQSTPEFVARKAKALDGHPTPATPFVRLSTGASGVGLASSIGLALAARDYFGADAPRVHVIEGEGGLTPGRASEALAAAGTAGLDNVILHVDWNQASIDTDNVCRDGDRPGDYVQWNPMELARLHDWNVIHVADGFDIPSVLAAQRRALELDTGQPTAIVYRTIKGWQYGIEGRASHGAGHGLCADGFFEAMMPLLTKYEESLPYCGDASAKRCTADASGAVLEECWAEALEVVRRVVAREPGMVRSLAAGVERARERLEARGRQPREDAPRVEEVYELARQSMLAPPPEVALAPGAETTLRGELGRALGLYNRESRGALLVASADLLGSTSVDAIEIEKGTGYFHARARPRSRRLALGGICEDAMAGTMSGLSTFGRHIGVASSYAAFLAPLGHVAARLHAIGCQARWQLGMDPYRPMILVCAHAGLKTGEDGPTHADPQALQLLQENFPRGTAITLTPWEPSEIWPLLAAALVRRPAILCPFVTRPAERVPDRARLGLAAADAAVAGVYALRRASGRSDGAVVLQGSGVTLCFIEQVLPRLLEEGMDLDVFYVASAELFDLLDEEQRRTAFPPELGARAMGITDFTLPTMYRWVTSERGRQATLHPYREGHFPGSGRADKVLQQAQLDGESQYRAVTGWVGRTVRV